MTSGFGVEETVTGGIVTSGTTAQDIRLILGALYTPGIVSGAAVYTSSSAMTYRVSAGVVVIEMAAYQNVVAPVPEFTYTAQPNNTAATRVDRVYVKQNTPETEGNSNVVIGVGPTIPARAVEIWSYNVPAGATTTSAALSTADRKYSIPYGSSKGVLYQYRYTANTTVINNTRILTTSLSVPTDRQVRLMATVCVSSQNAQNFDAADYCEMGIYPIIDGAFSAGWRTPGLHQAWAQYQFEDLIYLNAGRHTISVDIRRIIGPGSPLLHYAAGVHSGLLFTITDEGVKV